MDQELVKRIAATLGDDEPNPAVTVTLPGAVIGYLLKWADIGQERCDVDSSESDLLAAIMKEVDRKIILLGAKRDMGDLTESGVTVVNPKSLPPQDHHDCSRSGRAGPVSMIVRIRNRFERLQLSVAAGDVISARWDANQLLNEASRLVLRDDATNEDLTELESILNALRETAGWPADKETIT